VQDETSDPADRTRSIGGRVATGGMWAFGGRGASLIAVLVATPFTIRLLGPSRYGLLALLQSALTWAILTDLGMGTASTKLATEQYAEGDSRGESSVVWTALAITVGTTACAAAGAGIAAPVIVTDLLHVQGSLYGPGVVALRIACALLLVQVFIGTINTPQLVRLRWGGYTLVTQGVSVLQVVGIPIGLAVASGGVVTAAWVTLAAALIGALATLLLSARSQPSLFRSGPQRRWVRPLLAYGGALSVAGIAAIPLSTAERFFLAHYRSTASVAYYAVAMSLGTILAEVPYALIAPLMPGLVHLEASGQLDERRALYTKALQGLFLTCAPAALLLAFVAQPFLSVWAGPAYGQHGTGPFIVILAGELFLSLGYVPNSYLLAAGRTKLLALIDVSEVGPYLVMAALITARWGAVGAAAVWSARVIVSTLLYFGAAKRAGLGCSPLSGRRFASAASPLVFGAVLLLLALDFHGLPVRTVWAAVLGLAYGLVVWHWVLTAAERAGLSAMVVEVLPWLTKWQRH
jgi:O-antigen/teichoic acid export membrane protein